MYILCTNHASQSTMTWIGSWQPTSLLCKIEDYKIVDINSTCKLNPNMNVINVYAL